jgi:hypothetical protein
MWEIRRQRTFVRHLVEGALEAETLRQVHGVWQLRGRTAVTSELASLLDGRIDQLPDDVLHLLRLLTFCEPLDLDTVTSLVGSDAVEDAETRGLIRVVAEHHGVAHPIQPPVIRRTDRRRLAWRTRGGCAANSFARYATSPWARRASGSGWRS